MSIAVRELPDVETLVVKYLQSRSELTRAGVKLICGPESPNLPSYPMIYIHRAGGPATVPFWLDAGRIQMDICAKDTIKLRAIAAKVFVALQEMVGVHPEGVVNAVEETVGRQFVRAQDDGAARIVFEVKVSAHPNP